MAPSRRRSRQGVHPLLLPPAEAVHQLSGEGADRVDENAELAPGHDCCAVCAAACEPGVVCTFCKSVQYCSPQHLVDDAPEHAAVCPMLKCLRRVEARRESKQDLLPGTDAAPPSDGAEPSVAGNSGGGFTAPCAGRDGWAYIAPERFLRVYPQEEKAGRDAQAAGERARKRQRKDPGAQEGAGGAAAAASPSHPDSPGSDSDSDPGQTPDSAADSDTLLDLAADLADRTAVLTYPYTAALALRNAVGGTGDAAGSSRGTAADAGAGGSGSGAGVRQRPLRVVVLGAAGDAELADLESWRVVADAVGREVHLWFVGPEVPEELAGSRKRVGSVEMAFVQCTFDEALAGGAGGKASARGRTARELAGPPDAYLAFNPGFTCPDYEWVGTLEAMSRTAQHAKPAEGSSPGGGRPAAGPHRLHLIVATNTRSEAEMDAEMLREHGWLAQTAQPAPNPYTSLKVLQNGALANDLYRKNAWLTVYRHAADVQARRRLAGGRKGAKGAVGNAAQALYDTMVAPLTRLFKDKDKNKKRR